MSQPFQKNNYQIIPGEMGVMLIAMIVGTGVIVLPRTLVSVTNSPDGWISLLISNFLVMLLVYFTVRLQKKFPGKSFLEYIGEGKAGKWLSKILGVIFLVYFLSISAFLCRFLALVSNMYLLFFTPPEVIVMLYLLVSSYAVTKGVQGIVHLCLFFTPIVIFVLLVIISFEIPEIDVTNLLPIMGDGIMPVIKGVEVTTFAYLGIEILFFFMAYMKRADLRAAPVLVPVGIVSFIYLVVIIMTYGVFGLEITKTLTFPMVELLKQVELPGKIFERAESFMITIWVMTMFNTISIGQFLAVDLFKHIFTKAKKDWLLPLSVFIIFILAFVPDSIAEISTFSDWISLWGITAFIITLLCGYSVVWWRSKQQNKGRKEQV